MLLAPKYKAFDIPVIKPSTDVIDLTAPNPLSGVDGDSFVRAVIVPPEAGLVFEDLNECLAVTDEELRLAATASGAEVVEHEWGLYDGNRGPTPLPSFCYNLAASPYDNGDTLDLLPDGHILVATVPLLDIDELTGTQERAVEAGIEDYTASKNPGDYIFTDNNTGQYFNTRSVGSTAMGSRIVMLDIEPYIDTY